MSQIWYHSYNHHTLLYYTYPDFLLAFLSFFLLGFFFFAIGGVSETSELSPFFLFSFPFFFPNSGVSAKFPSAVLTVLHLS